ncbi:protein of unknown function [Rhodovastum atsumiense]|uniref:hypothetical protein n=1 Tax=Rhodovastum atsumiense TaxID=504468 RepID=UPI00193AE458|nr:hypothetical protein [Rhodovastum atsumiense]CAH2603208.1 protein of unknown function [Rhodovastum atsumiense]
MAYHLFVREPFGDWKKGDKITDPATVARILGDEDAAHVVKTAAPAETPAVPVAEG